MDGGVILFYSGSQRLTVPNGTITTNENGWTKHIIKTTGIFAYNVAPTTNPITQSYQWRADALAIGGGGRGGVDIGAGGGAGAYIYTPHFWVDNTKSYSVVIGAGQVPYYATPTPSASISGSDSYILDASNSAVLV